MRPIDRTRGGARTGRANLRAPLRADHWPESIPPSMNRSRDAGPRRFWPRHLPKPAVASVLRIRLLSGALAIAILTVPLSACGAGSTSGAASSAAENVVNSASGAAAKAKNATVTTKADAGTRSTVTATKTQAVTGPTKTVTKTSTSRAAPATIINSKSVTVQATQTTPVTSSSGSGGVPWWGWALIALGAIAVVAAIFAEYAGASEGLGIYMENAKNSFRIDLVLAAVLVSAVLTLALFALTYLVERLAIPWYRLSRQGGRE